MSGEYNWVFPELQSSGIGSTISTESGPQYEYPGATFSENVAQTRLLTILPGRKQEPVRCTLRSVRLEGIESYEALSYAWGNPTFTRVILINETRFRVGENLFQALNHVRLPSSERVMWVDAICINQTDINERNLQVRQMSAIYSRAQLVMVWLGLETASSNAAFEFLRSTAAFNPPSREELINDRGWDAFIELCERDYWKRVWIVQEICLAARIVIVCGSNQVPWKHISNLRKSILNLRAWERISSLEKEYLQSLPARIDQQRESRLKSGCMLWGLLENFQDSLCQDIHDKIYGLLGLSNDCSQSILIDYSKSVNELYKDVMWFYHEKFRKDSNSSLPQGPQLMKLSEFLQNLLAYHPQSSDDIWLLENEERNSQGPSRQLVAVDKEISDFVNISACGVLVVRRFLSPGETGDISEVVDFLDGSAPYSDIGKWRTVIDPILSGVYAITNSPAYATSHGAICRRKDSVEKISYPSAFIADPPDGPADSPAVNPTERLLEWNDSPKYAIGIAPAGTQTGDVVLLFLESKTALILRPPSTGGTPSTVHDGYEVISSGRYTLVGRAAMDLSNEGVMDFVRQYRSQVRLDKRVETTPSPVQVGGRNYPAISGSHIVTNPQKLWPMTLSIDILSLRLLTRVQSSLLTLWPLGNRGDIKPPSKVMTEGNSILPEQGLVTLSWRTRPAHYTPNFGYVGIINLGATGYISCTLQLLYMLKPFRMVTPPLFICNTQLIILEHHARGSATTISNNESPSRYLPRLGKFLSACITYGPYKINWLGESAK